MFNTFMWLYIIIAVIVLGGLGFCFLSKKKKGATENIAEEMSKESGAEESMDMPEEGQLETSTEDAMSEMSGEDLNEEIKM